MNKLKFKLQPIEQFYCFRKTWIYCRILLYAMWLIIPMIVSYLRNEEGKIIEDGCGWCSGWVEWEQTTRDRRDKTITLIDHSGPDQAVVAVAGPPANWTRVKLSSPHRCHIKMSPPWKIRPVRNNHGFDMSSPYQNIAGPIKSLPIIGSPLRKVSPADN